MLQVLNENFEFSGEPSVYSFGTHMAAHFFCPVCGVCTHHAPRSSVDHTTVNVGCLEDVDVSEFANVPCIKAKDVHPNEEKEHSFYGTSRFVVKEFPSDRPIRFFEELPHDELLEVYKEQSNRIKEGIVFYHQLACFYYCIGIKGINKIWRVG